jgi:PIN domain nuclease of toxin-antitoxin system
MTYLLDTQVFLWWDSDSPRLGPRAREILSDPTQAIYVSAVSVWEISIKASLGKLAYSGSPTEAISQNQFRSLSIVSRDAEAVIGLPPIHKDPFDRLLIAQARRRGLTLITSDHEIVRYTLSYVAAEA